MRADGDRAHELRPRQRLGPGERRALHLHELVDGHRLGRRVEARELREEAGARVARFAHAHDAAAAHVDAGAAHALERVEAVLVVARRDHLAVELGRGVEVVVVVVEARIAKLLRLAVLQHAERAAGLEAELLHLANHVEHGLEVARLGAAPGRAHAEARRAILLRGRRRAHHVVERQHRLALDPRGMARRLRAVAAVLGAAARLDGQQRRALDPVRVEILAVDCLRLEEQIVEGKVEEGPRLGRAGSGSGDPPGRRGARSGPRESRWLS